MLRHSNTLKPTEHIAVSGEPNESNVRFSFVLSNRPPCVNMSLLLSWRMIGLALLVHSFKDLTLSAIE